MGNCGSLVFHPSDKFSEVRPGRKALVGNSVRHSSSMEVTSLMQVGDFRIEGATSFSA